MMLNHRTLWHVDPFKRGVLLAVALALSALMLALVGMSLPTQAAPLARANTGFEITPPDGSLVEPGDLITYVFETSETGTYDGIYRFDLAPGLSIQTVDPVTDSQGSDVQSGLVLTWTTTGITGTRYFTVVAQVPMPPEILGQEFETTAYFESNAARFNMSEESAVHRLYPAITTSSMTEISATLNSLHEAVAGEIVTTTVTYTIPAGTTAYSLTPRIQLDEGLRPYAADPMWDELLTDTFDSVAGIGTNPIYELRYGAPFTVENEATDIGKTYTIYARAVPTLTNGNLINNGSDLIVRPIMRWTPESTGTIDEGGNAPYLAVNEVADLTFLRPDVRSNISLKTTTLLGGGDEAVFEIISTNAQDYATAYDGVLTFTLASGMGVVDASGAGNYTSGGEVVTWTLPALAAQDVFTSYVTATLPSPIDIGVSYPVTAQVYQESLPGDVQWEGVYTTSSEEPEANPRVFAFAPGLAHAKQVSADTVEVGDVLTYTITLTVARNAELPSPRYTDTLPLGFHLAGPVVASGADITVTSYITAAGPETEIDDEGFFIPEEIIWEMENPGANADPRVVTIQYHVINTGFDYAGEAVYVDNLNLKDTIELRNAAVLTWEPTDPDAVNRADPIETLVTLTQPAYNNIYAERTDGNPDIPLEPGFTGRFKLYFETDDTVPAYDVQLCDQLPDGISFGGNYNDNISDVCPDAELLSGPILDQTGEVCWLVDKHCANTEYEIEYTFKTSEDATPGYNLYNAPFVKFYTNKPGPVAGERNYGQFPEAFPVVDEVAYVIVRGLKMVKTPSTPAGEMIDPGEYLTYTIRYTNTRVSSVAYANPVITDTYDSHLIYVSADVTPTIEDTANRQLVWSELEDLGQGESGEIVMRMQVAPTVLYGTTKVRNHLAWDSDETIPFERYFDTEVSVAHLNMRVEADQETTAVSEEIDYTVTYSNTGTATKDVTITLDYSPYVAYVSDGGDADLVVGTDNVFTEAGVQNNGNESELEVKVLVTDTLPYDVDAIPLVVTIESLGAEPQVRHLSIPIERPVFEFVKEKVGSPSAPPVGEIMEYRFYITNTGSLKADNLIVTDTLAEGTSYRASPGWSYYTDPEPHAVYDSILELDINQSISFTLQVDVDATQTFYENTAQLSSDQTGVQYTSKRVWQASIATWLSADPVPAFPGRVFTYTVDFRNDAGKGVEQTVITMDLPPDFDFVTTDASESAQDACGVSDGDDIDWAFNPDTGVWSCSNLREGYTGSLLVHGTVPEESEGNIWKLEVESGSADPGMDIPDRPAENSPLLTRVARPHLSLDKVVDPATPAAVGDYLTYTLTYSNTGTDPAYDVVIKDYLDEDLAFVTGSSDISYTEGSHVVAWMIPEVPTDTTDTVWFKARVKQIGDGQAVNDGYTIESERLSTADTTSGAAVMVDILAPELTLTKAADPLSINSTGDPITFTVSYTNTGGGMLTNVVITDALSDYVGYADSSGCSHEGGVPGGLVTCNIGDLQQGEAGSVWFRVSVVNASAPEISNQAFGYSNQTDITSSNIVKVSTPSTCYPPTGLKFTYEPDPAQAGVVMTFTASIESGDTSVEYTWDFDGDEATGQVVVYTFPVSGTYPVKVIADNNCGDPVEYTEDIVVPGAPEMQLTPETLEATTTVGAVEFAAPVTISNTGTADLSWTASITWMASYTGELFAIEPTSGTVTPGSADILTVTVVPTDLVVGTYTGTLTINDEELSITLEVQSEGTPQIAVTPTSLTHSAQEGDTAVLTRTLTIANEGNVALTWNVTITPTAAWLSVDPASGSTVAGGQSSLIVSFDPDGLDANTYTSNLSITSNAEDVLVPVTFDITKFEIFLPLVLKLQP